MAQAESAATARPTIADAEDKEKQEAEGVAADGAATVKPAGNKNNKSHASHATKEGPNVLLPTSEQS